MQDITLYYWHDGVLEKTPYAKENHSHLLVFSFDGVPVASSVYTAEEVVRRQLAPYEPEGVEPQP